MKTSRVTVPDRPEGMSEMAYRALQLTFLCSELALEERTLVHHPGGRPESVAEHSAMLAIIAPTIAEEFYPDLDANLIARYASIHDAVEAYVGDTPTHNISNKGFDLKAEREAIGLEQLRSDFRMLPKFVVVIDEYEDQKIAEARFVRIVDKLMPILVHFTDKGVGLRKVYNYENLLKDQSRRANRLRREYPDFPELVDTRIELTKSAADKFLK